MACVGSGTCLRRAATTFACCSDASCSFVNCLRATNPRITAQWESHVRETLVGWGWVGGGANVVNKVGHSISQAGGGCMHVCVYKHVQMVACTYVRACVCVYVYNGYTSMCLGVLTHAFES